MKYTPVHAGGGVCKDICLAILKLMFSQILTNGILEQFSAYTQISEVVHEWLENFSRSILN